MKIRKLIVVGVMAAAALIPAGAASANEVTVHDPVTDCDYTVGWYVNPQNLSGTNAYSYGTCTG